MNKIYDFPSGYLARKRLAPGNLERAKNLAMSAGWTTFHVAPSETCDIGEMPSVLSGPAIY